jgi:ribose transport system permease protein
MAGANMSTAAAQMARRRVLSGELAGFMYRVAGVVLVCVGLSLATDAFLTVSNLLNVLRQASLIFLVASGVTLVVLTAGLDLSVGANVGLRAS